MHSGSLLGGGYSDAMTDVQDGLDRAIALVVGRGLRGRTSLIGVDGLGASGKTTFAGRLAEAIGGVVVHVDDLSAPGSKPWEIDRFLRDVWTPLSQGRAARYRLHHWTGAEPGEWAEVPTGVPVILEGVRSTARANPAPFELRIWVDADPPTRLARAEARDPGRFGCWTTNWMPIEDGWRAEERPDLAADLVVRT